VPQIFADPCLFRSCSGIYSEEQLADIIECISDKHSLREQLSSERHRQELQGCKERISGLTADLGALLKPYLGRRITGVRGNSPDHTRAKLSGTVLRIDDETGSEVVVMWHHNASVSNLTVGELLLFSLH
jgi:hypothetical protein